MKATLMTNKSKPKLLAARDRMAKTFDFSRFDYQIPIMVADLPREMTADFTDAHKARYEMLALYYGAFVSIPHLPMFIDFIKVYVECDKTHKELQDLTLAAAPLLDDAGGVVADDIIAEQKLQYIYGRWERLEKLKHASMRAMSLTADRIRNAAAKSGITESLDLPQKTADDWRGYQASNAPKLKKYAN